MSQEADPKTVREWLEAVPGTIEEKDCEVLLTVTLSLGHLEALALAMGAKFKGITLDEAATICLGYDGAACDWQNAGYPDN